MSKKTENTLLLPGPEGWEVWQGTREQGFRRTLENGPAGAAELEKLPKGRRIMAFPVREALAVPFKVQTEDASMFDDLAAMHLEKIGIRPDVGAGRLTDVFPAGQADGNASLLNVVLAAPGADTMPAEAPELFDVSPRFFPLPDNAVTLWRELGRWVFSISSGGHLMYFQALPGASLGADAVRDIRLALSQLSLQGVELEMDSAVVWTTGHSSDPPDDAIQSLGEALGAEVLAEPKPRPVLPEKISRLVPADVRAEQRAKAARRKRNTLVAAALVAYLGAVGYFAYNYYGLSQQAEAQKKELERVNLAHGDIGLFDEDWNDLAPLVDDRHWPLTALYRSTEIIPPNQSQSLRFKVFKADSQGIYINGEATDIKQASVFGEKLEKSMPDYEWKKPVLQNNAKVNRWEFTFEGVLKGGETES